MKDEQYLLIDEDRSFEYIHVIGSVIEKDSDGIYRTPVLSDSNHVPYPQIYCQGDSGTGHLYGFSVRYRDIHTATLRDLNDMQKYLSRIIRGMDKLNEDFGHTGSYSEYFLRAAKVMRITQFVREDRRCGRDYISMSASDVRYHIDQIESKLTQKESA